ncbi:reverse transcriptase [Caerostris extrusa]|uniref:Reverse transcriptase n=1 Tax=Caerostris extrusa TaxID=172846 RepID=A0AAV4WJR2_CAEEX|nr:reverse transcriptase [Caerostris extrusa]
MVYKSEEDLKNYDNLKTVVFKEFQTTPQECFNHFRKAVKSDSESYVQLASRLMAIFDYCQLRVQQTASNKFLSELESFKCVLCKGNRALHTSPKFNVLTVTERNEILKEHQACFKCFAPECSAVMCKYKTCFCGKPHNRVIHFQRENEKAGEMNVDERSGENYDSSNPSVVASNLSRKEPNALLSTI